MIMKQKKKMKTFTIEKTEEERKRKLRTQERTILRRQFKKFSPKFPSEYRQ